MRRTEEQEGLSGMHQKVAFEEHIVVPENGYIYIWLSNESENTHVWFDDLKVNREGADVVQATDYGAWGDVIREQKTEPTDMYRWYYQGQYAERDLETGWSHFELREYDPVVGRWTVVDPKRIGWSPYIGMYNNPANGIDPDGGGPDDIIVTTNNGKHLFTLDDGKEEITTLTLMELYQMGIQWFEPLADNYMPIKFLNPEITNFNELKHFTWEDIVNFSIINRPASAFRSKGGGDWKYVSEGADEFFGVTVDGFPYWADAIGQFPYAINTYKNTGNISTVLRLAVEHGHGTLTINHEQGNTYDIYFVLRGALYASQRFNYIRNPRTTNHVERKSFPGANSLAAPINMYDAKKYGLR